MIHGSRAKPASQKRKKENAIMKTKKNAPETTPATTGLETTPETAAAAPKEPAEKPAPKKASAKKAATKKAATKKATKPAKASKPAKGAKKAGTNKPAARAAEKPAPRETRKAMVLAMIARKNGATLDEIMAATDWQRHTVRGFISIAGRDPEIQIESTKNEKGQRVYRLK